MPSVVSKLKEGDKLVQLERRASLALFLFLLGYGAFVAPQKVARSRMAEEKRAAGLNKRSRAPKEEGRLQDHPLFPFFATNGMAIALTVLREKLIGNPEIGMQPVKVFWRMFASSVFMIEGMIVWNYFMINHVYAHIPFFSEKRPKQTNWEIFRDYLRCNTVNNLLICLFQTMIFRKMRESDLRPLEPSDAPFRPIRFLFRTLWIRFFVDVAFWLGHKVMHDRIYSMHKRHHEHNKTTLTTNYHFRWDDLLVEGFTPFFIGAATYEQIFAPIGLFDLTILQAYVFNFEILSHAGKPMPTMNLLPPFSPLLQVFDDFNSWFHEVHHRVLKCNFSISPWFDVLMGTDRWDL